MLTRWEPEANPDRRRGQRLRRRRRAAGHRGKPENRVRGAGEWERDQRLLDQFIERRPDSGNLSGLQSRQRATQQPGDRLQQYLPLRRVAGRPRHRRWDDRPEHRRSFELYHRVHWSLEFHSGGPCALSRWGLSLRHRWRVPRQRLRVSGRGRHTRHSRRSFDGRTVAGRNRH